MNVFSLTIYIYFDLLQFKCFIFQRQISGHFMSHPILSSSCTSKIRTLSSSDSLFQNPCRTFCHFGRKFLAVKDIFANTYALLYTDLLRASSLKVKSESLYQTSLSGELPFYSQNDNIAFWYRPLGNRRLTLCPSSSSSVHWKVLG